MLRRDISNLYAVLVIITSLLASLALVYFIGAKTKSFQAGGYCGDGQCNPQIGENCEACPIDCPCPEDKVCEPENPYADEIGCVKKQEVPTETLIFITLLLLLILAAVVKKSKRRR